MRVRRTGAKRGQSPTWYIQAETEVEKMAFRMGLMRNASPKPRLYRFVVRWGYDSRDDAEAELPKATEEVIDALYVVRSRVDDAIEDLSVS
jgi:hypothetical protein